MREKLSDPWGESRGEGCSVAFMAYGLQTASGDLDICIDLEEQNLGRLSTLLLEDPHL